MHVKGFRFKQYLRICLLIYLSVLYPGTLSHDTFVCKRAEADDVANITEQNDQKFRELEGRIADLEEKLNLVSDATPGVIRLQQNTIPRDCSDLYYNGETTSGVYRVSPDGRCAFEVYCDLTNGGWTVIQRRQTGVTDFRRTWNEYVNGFGTLLTDFWLGLDKIHRLTQGGSMLHFQLQHYGKRNRTSWGLYQGFVVNDVISGYAMNVDTFGYNGSMEELLSYHNGAKFSTMDRDQDMFYSSCSEEMGGGGGWWYNSCYRLGILNGKFGEKVKGGNAFWDTKRHFVKETEIKIKPMIGTCEFMKN